MKKGNFVIAVCLVLMSLLAGAVVYQQLQILSSLDRIKKLEQSISQTQQEYQSLREDRDRLNSTLSKLLNSFQMLSEEEVFVLGEDNVRREVWRGFNNDGVGESIFADYKFRMWINDTTGGWALSKVSRGLMPHGWGLRYAPLNEIELSKTNPPNVTLDITLKPIDFRNYTPNNSSMNVAIVLFFDGYVTDYQEACYQTEIQFFSYYGDRVQTNQAWYFVWRNDSIAQFKLANNLQKGKTMHYEMNITPYITDMMNHYNLSRVKLKHMEIFTETYKGYSEFELYYAKIAAIKSIA